MSKPRTTLDSRFSGPGTSSTSWEDAQLVIEQTQLFWLTTVRRDGRPHVTPLVAVWLDGAVYFGTGAGEQKARNLSSNSHVSLTTGRNEWDRGLDVVVEGDAVRVTDDELLGELAKAWAKKWDGQWQYEVHDGHLRDSSQGADADVLVFSVVPTTVFAFGKGTFTQTRHRF